MFMYRGVAWRQSGSVRGAAVYPYAKPRASNRVRGEGMQESNGVHSGVDRVDADGTRVSGQESTSPPTTHPLKTHLSRGGLKGRCHRDFGPRSDSRRSTIIITARLC